MKEPLPQHVLDHVERTHNQSSYPRLKPVSHPVLKEPEPEPKPDPVDDVEEDEPERIKRQYIRKKDNT